MTPFRPAIAATLLLAGLLLARGAAAAGDGGTTIFEGATPPPAADLARILWPAEAAPKPTPAEGRKRGLTRSIRIGAPAEMPAAPEAPATAMAAAEPPAAAPPAQRPGSFGFLIRFGFDSAAVKEESRPYLERLGEMLALPEAQGRRLLIVGHTDASGPDGYNVALSERRALAVRDYLRDRLGVDPSRLEVEGVGKAAPVAGLDPRAPQNRRVEFRAAGG